MSTEEREPVGQVNMKKTMTKGSIWSKILLFAIPIMLSNMFNQLYTAVDSMIVGKYVGHEALAAVGANNSVINVMLCLFLGLGVGSGVIVSQRIGAGDGEGVKKAVHTMMLVAIISGIFLTVVGLFLSRPILSLLDTPADVIDLSVVYLDIYFAGVAFVIIYNVGAGILRASGNSLMPFLYLLASCLINVGLDYLFVAVYGWGVAGAAWATVISIFVSAVCVVVHLCITKGPVKLRFKDLRIDKKMLGSIARIGIPIGLQTSMYSFANILIQANLNRYGSIVMASWTAANKVDSFCFAPVSAFGGAINTYVGQNYGAKEYDRIKKGVLTTILMAEITAFIMMIPLLIYAKPVLSLFNDNPQVLEYGKQIMFMVIPVYTLFGLSEVLSGTLKGVGRTITSAIVSFTGILLVRVIWLYAVLPFFQTERVLFMVHPISWIVTSVIFVVYFIVMGWKRIFTVPTLGKKSKLAQAEDALKEAGQGGMIE